MHDPDYVNVRPERRWPRPLPGLRPVLDKEARETPQAWAWRILPRGACVAVQVDGPLWRVRVSRREVPGHQLTKWLQEVAVFERELRLDGWDQDDVVDPLGVSVTFSCRADLLCESGCGRKISANAQLFDSRTCDSCGLATATGRSG